MMSTNCQPQQPNKKRATVFATDEFWNTPIAQDLPCAGDSSAASDDDMELYLPPAHHQLLGLYKDQPTYENLKGYDHTQSVISYGNLDGYDTEDLFHDLDSSFCCRRRQTRLSLSDVKQQGGGSWLLGFARIRDESTDAASPQDATPPGLVRVPSASSFESDDSSDDESTVASSPSKPRSRGVSFSPTVKVQPVPHSSSLSPIQRRKMYSSTLEVRMNKSRNKKEYRYDGCDWRSATEEWEMSVDMVTGEMIHPAHDHL